MRVICVGERESSTTFPVYFTNKLLTIFEFDLSKSALRKDSLSLFTNKLLTISFELDLFRLAQDA